jgi:hypothetical protein
VHIYNMTTVSKYGTEKSEGCAHFGLMTGILSNAKRFLILNSERCVHPGNMQPVLSKEWRSETPGLRLYSPVLYSTL